VLTQTQPITVLFSLPEDQLAPIMQRLAAGATLDVAAFDRSNTTKLATGKLSAVDSQIDPTTGTVKMRAQFDNENGVLFPNQFVNVQILVNTVQGATVIPTAAVQRGAPGTFVYVVKPDDTVAVQPIKLGPAQGERVAVASGLSPGARVVVDGADKLKENAKVVLRPESPPVATQGGAPQGGNAAVTGNASAPATAAAPGSSAAPGDAAATPGTSETPARRRRSGGS
jgi:membrane fusion protein, multidrug efflux system